MWIQILFGDEVNKVTSVSGVEYEMLLQKSRTRLMDNGHTSLRLIVDDTVATGGGDNLCISL